MMFERCCHILNIAILQPILQPITSSAIALNLWQSNCDGCNMADLIQPNLVLKYKKEYPIFPNNFLGSNNLPYQPQHIFYTQYAIFELFKCKSSLLLGAV